LCICQTRIYKTKAKETISGSIQQFQCLGVRADIWERCAVTWAVRGSERAIFLKKFTSARLPGRCADIWERRADIWAARGFLGIKSHLIIKTSSKFAYICRGMFPLRVLWWFEDSKGGFQSQSHARNPWRNDWCFASLMFWWFVLFSRQFFLISPSFHFPLVITCVYMSFLSISCAN